MIDSSSDNLQPTQVELDDITESFMQAMDRVDAERAEQTPWHCPDWCTVPAEHHEDEDARPGNGWLHMAPTWSELAFTVRAEQYEPTPGSNDEEIDKGIWIDVRDGHLTNDQALALILGTARALRLTSSTAE